MEENGAMIYRVGPATALAEQLRDVLAGGDKHAALRLVAEFVWDVDHAGADARAPLLDERPGPTGAPQWDAMLAGVAEMLALRHGLRVPPWTAEPDRFLATWWWFADQPAWMVSAFTNTPAALANRGVFLHASALTSV
jgi:hypothetical protein